MPEEWKLYLLFFCLLVSSILLLITLSSSSSPTPRKLPSASPLPLALLSGEENCTL